MRTRGVVESKSANDLLSRSNISFFVQQSFEESGKQVKRSPLRAADLDHLKIHDVLGPEFKLAEKEERYRGMSRPERTRLMAEVVWSLDQRLPRNGVMERRMRLKEIVRDKQRRKTIREADPTKKIVTFSNETEEEGAHKLVKVEKAELPSKGVAQRKFREKLFEGTRM